ncbi:MAG: hypothetical protein OEV11_08240, partial [Deltaproteobacteria bacterium]|nr:hypothetical protein [Deltaproteobacteria bacterium]
YLYPAGQDKETIPSQRLFRIQPEGVQSFKGFLSNGVFAVLCSQFSASILRRVFRSTEALQNNKSQAPNYK